MICSNFTTFVVESPIAWHKSHECHGCDLLKFHYLCGRITNLCGLIPYKGTVVICSNFTTFVVESPMLHYFDDIDFCCDLLKFHYLCGRITNTSIRRTRDGLVVICSNFTTFVVESPILGRRIRSRKCCDLLKFHYLCGRITNYADRYRRALIVVICSNFTTFVVESPIQNAHL